MVGVATGTAMFLSALPAPSLPTLGISNITSKHSKRSRIQKLLNDAHSASKEHYGVKSLKVGDLEGVKWTDSEDSEEEVNDLDLSAGNKDTCVLEVSFSYRIILLLFLHCCYKASYKLIKRFTHLIVQQFLVYFTKLFSETCVTFCIFS